MRWRPSAYPRLHARHRLFCLPYAGGGSATFARWGRNLPEWIEVCPVEIPGRQTRHHEPPLRSMGALVSFVVDQIEPFTNLPYTLLGHSLGAVVAYEALAELRRRRAPAPRRLVASGAPAPHLPRRSREIHRLPDGDFWRAILEMGGTPTALIESEPLKRLVIGTLRADLEVAETYRCSGAPVEIPVLAIAGERDRMVDAERVLAWRDLARADFEFATSPGGHFFVHEHETEVLRLLRDTLVRNETESTRRPAA